MKRFGKTTSKWCFLGGPFGKSKGSNMSAMERNQVQMLFHDFAMEDEGLLAMLAEPRDLAEPWLLGQPSPTQNGDAKPRCPLPVRSPEGASGSQHGPFWPGHRWGANFKPLTVRDWATHKFASLAIEQHGLLDFHRFPWSIAFESEKRAKDAPEHFVWWQYV